MTLRQHTFAPTDVEVCPEYGCDPEIPLDTDVIDVEEALEDTTNNDSIDKIDEENNDNVSSILLSSLSALFLINP